MVDNFYPPHSRLFVACDKETTEQELIGAFQCYGSVENINLCRDRNSGAPKGIAFVQFDKTSEAAAALEALNGTCIGKSTRPVKVSVALAKDQSASSNDPSQFLRLFLVCPKSATENELLQYFSQFGQVDLVSIVKDRETKESKGFAYIKFKKFSHAAKAFENCDRSYRVVFAKPKEQQQQQQITRPMDHGMSHGSVPLLPDPVITCTHIDDNPEGYTCLKVIVSANLSDEQIEWLFDIPPGLEFVRFFNEPPFMTYSGLYMRKVLAKYDSPGTAAYALRKLDGFEYPAGEKVDVQPDYNSVENPMGRGGRDLQAGASTRSVASLVQQVESLSKSLSEATKLISSGHGPAGKSLLPPSLQEALRCTAKLPPVQPLAPPHTPIQERLFFVCEPGLPPQEVLWDTFCRFGNMIDLHILSGKSCGYAKYANKANAQRAAQALNGQSVYRMKMKVMIAEPQEDRKRPRAFD